MCGHLGANERNGGTLVIRERVGLIAKRLWFESELLNR